MSDFLKILTNNRRLKAAARKASSEELEKVYAQIGVILEDRKVEEEAELLEIQEREAAREAILAQMEEAGINVDDLTSEKKVKTSKKRKSKRAVKYRYTDKSGTEYTWAGVGRAPRVFAEFKAQGKLEKYRVD
ncbi:MAG: H-NS family nucleoid-associated regulatory protein [Parahaliea sp.]